MAVWGPWATAGLGALIYFIWSMVQVMVFACVAAMYMMNSPGEGSFQSRGSDVLQQRGLGRRFNFKQPGGVGAHLDGHSVSKKGGVPQDYLALKPISAKTIAVVLAITAAVAFSTDFLTYVLGKPIVDAGDIKAVHQRHQ